MAHFAALRTHPLEFRNTAALAAVGMLVATAFGLSTLITPLYLIYQKAFGFSQITLTLIYAVGRRPSTRNSSYPTRFHGSACRVSARSMARRFAIAIAWSRSSTGWPVWSMTRLSLTIAK
ncbi:hypothetical protein [Bradyrhizobium tropiciagri]|uniref:hypothetical protein n=1 Tax=Bradyrhizobium tropiciagri TaxID=312253 RepID=UPI00067C8294|nr:hypothetical protein [Bradyrhizobium tropiciagri]